MLKESLSANTTSGSERTRWADIPTVAVLLDMSERTVRRRIADGTIPARRFGRLLRVDVTELECSPEPETARDAHLQKLEQYIERVVASAPPLTAEQKDRLAEILRGAS